MLNSVSVRSSETWKLGPYLENNLTVSFSFMLAMLNPEYN
jgi:hypothetical protein